MVKQRKDRFIILCYGLLIICSLVAIVPFFLLIIASFTEESHIIKFGYSFFPEAWSLDAYKYLLEQRGQIFRAYGISLFVTIIGTIAGVTLTLLLAFPLSRPGLPGRKVVSFFVFFTMLFNGGLVPSYIMWTTTFGIKNSIFAQILPNLLMKGFYIILARSYFQNSIPDAILESATIDGASDFRAFIQIVLPLSKPIISTLILFTALGYWNDWSNGLVYINDPTLYTIQNVLNDMLRSLQFLEQNSNFVPSIKLPSGTVRMAIAVVGTIPVLIAYPFLQRGFIKGIVLGGVKG